MTVRYDDAVQEQLPAINTLVYTCPSTAKSAQIIFGNCTNADTTDSTLTVNLVKSGDSAGVTNQYIDTKTIVAGDSDPLSEILGVTLLPGDFVSAIADVADRLNLKISIKVIS